MIPRSLLDHLARHVVDAPDQIAVASGDDAITYRELWDRILLAANRLRDEGVHAGDRVLLAAAPTPEFLSGYFACHLLRAVATPFAPDVAASKLQGILAAIGPRVVLAAPRTPVGLPGHKFLSISALTGTAEAPRSDAFDWPEPEDAADMLLTSGTTGDPKGIVLTHRNILAAARNINQFVGNISHDREALALPLDHSFGLGRLRCQILAGGTLILTPGLVFPKLLFDSMKRWNVTGFSFVPAGWAMLTRLTGEKLAGFSGELRYIEIGSAPMPLEEKRRLMRLFPRTRLCMHYGLTEASRSSFIEFHSSGDRLDSVGRPAPNVAIRIVDEEGVEMPLGRPGRILIQGEHVLESRWNPDMGRRVSQGWLRSGDMGYQDAQGYLYLCGREDDVVNIGGRKVHPAEVEQLLLAHDGVEDSVCVAIPDPENVTGERIQAFLVSRPGRRTLPSSQRLTEFLAHSLEDYKIPIAFEWVTTIPRNALGKINRKTVGDLLRGALVDAGRDG